MRFSPSKFFLWHPAADDATTGAVSYFLFLLFLRFLFAKATVVLSLPLSVLGLGGVGRREGLLAEFGCAVVGFGQQPVSYKWIFSSSSSFFSFLWGRKMREGEEWRRWWYRNYGIFFLGEKMRGKRNFSGCLPFRSISSFWRQKIERSRAYISFPSKKVRKKFGRKYVHKAFFFPQHISLL